MFKRNHLVNHGNYISSRQRLDFTTDIGSGDSAAGDPDIPRTENYQQSEQIINPLPNGSINLDTSSEPISDNSTPSSTYYQKHKIGPEANALIAHASRISNNDLDFIATLDKESAGTWDPNVTSKRNRNGSYDKGICQFNSYYYSHLYSDPNWNNGEWQINKCYELYSDWKKRGIIGKRMFAWNKRHASKKNFYLVTNE